MAMELRTLHKIETGPVMEMMEKTLRITTEYCLGYIFISDEHIGISLYSINCSLVSAVWSQEYEMT